MILDRTSSSLMDESMTYRLITASAIALGDEHSLKIHRIAVENLSKINKASLCEPHTSKRAEGKGTQDGGSSIMVGTACAGELVVF